MYNRDLTDKQIVTCCYKLLTKLPNEFSIKWDWSIFIHRFSDHFDVEVRRYGFYLIFKINLDCLKVLSHILLCFLGWLKSVW